MPDKSFQQNPSGAVAGREMSLRYAGECTDCGLEIPKGTRVVYSPSTRTVRLVTCTTTDKGTAGGSARREYQQRKAHDDAHVETQKQNVRAVFGNGVIGKIATALAVDDSPRTSTSVWAQGAVGEKVVAARLDALAELGVVSLHDRRIPKSRATSITSS
ncbi:hypothetical protein [Glaciibacter flavus]|uniref:hypothetical protein n=1 Tax=Orlajensenia flava TaxID=2565934 RepID=UPI003B00742A